VLVLGKAPVLHYIEYMAIGFVAYAGYSLIKKNVNNILTVSLALFSGILAILINSAIVFPILILLGGFLGSFFNAEIEERKLGTRLITGINLYKLFYFIGIFVLFALIGALVNRTSPFSLPIRLFQNFYRNGIFIYGGGQVLIPYLYTEMVEMKHYLGARNFYLDMELGKLSRVRFFLLLLMLGRKLWLIQGLGLAAKWLEAF
jgi:chromate transporter